MTCAPDDVKWALERMCRPLDDTILPSAGATASCDARCMEIIRNYVADLEAKVQFCHRPAHRELWASHRDLLAAAKLVTASASYRMNIAAVEACRHAVKEAMHLPSPTPEG